MQVGDLVRFQRLKDAKYVNRPRTMGVIIGGPNQGYEGMEPCDRFKVAWFDTAGSTLVHLESRLEVVSHASR